MGAADGVGRRAGTMAAPAAADSFLTRAASHLKAGPGVQLQLESFVLKKGNGTCGTGTPEERPDLVSPGQSHGFCYEANGFSKTGYYSADTEFTFKYNVLIYGPYGIIGGSAWHSSGYRLWGHVLIIARGSQQDNQWGCGIEQTDPNQATKHYDCQS